MGRRRTGRVHGVLSTCCAAALLATPGLRAQEWIDLTHDLASDAVFWPDAARYLGTDLRGGSGGPLRIVARPSGNPVAR